MTDEHAARAVAFYLPQFHPIPENDEWWGPGFTEWTNAAKARPLFPGHQQPTLPGRPRLLRPAGARDPRGAGRARARSTASRRSATGTTGSAAADRILERPFTRGARQRRAAVSFCLAWANQTWTGIWHGAADRVLMEQTYPGPEDDQAHFDAHPRRVPRRALPPGRRPPGVLRLPARGAPRRRARSSTDGRQMARAGRLDGLYLVAEISDLLGRGPRYTDGERDGFDASVYIRLPGPDRAAATSLTMRARRKLLRGPEVYPYARDPMPLPDRRRRRPLQPCVYPNWDNTPRSGRRGLALHGLDARDASGRTSARPSTRSRPGPAEERLLWVKSWNEWAEGNHLEPDLRYGHGWLQALPARICAVAGDGPAAHRDDLVLPAQREQDRRRLPGPRAGRRSWPSRSRRRRVQRVRAGPRRPLRPSARAALAARCARSGSPRSCAALDLSVVRRAARPRRRLLDVAPRAPMHVRTLHGSCFEEALHIRGVKEKTRMVLLGFTEVLASLVADRTVRRLARDAPVDAVGLDRHPERRQPASRLRPTRRAAEHPAVLFVGTWEGRKRGRMLAEAFVEHVLPALPDAELWMVTQDVPDDVRPSGQARSAGSATRSSPTCTPARGSSACRRRTRDSASRTPRRWQRDSRSSPRRTPARATSPTRAEPGCSSTTTVSGRSCSTSCATTQRTRRPGATAPSSSRSTSPATYEPLYRVVSPRYEDA